jgi:hypothetical protein
VGDDQVRSTVRRYESLARQLRGAGANIENGIMWAEIALTELGPELPVQDAAAARRLAGHLAMLAREMDSEAKRMKRGGC